MSLLLRACSKHVDHTCRIQAAHHLDTARHTKTEPTNRPWGEPEVAAWRASTKVHRLYQDDVLAKIEVFEADKDLDVVQYGALKTHVDEGRYPLFAIKTKNWDPAKPSVLVTGGVHGT